MAPPPYDPKVVEPKWQRVWEEKKVHRANAAPGKPKFFATVPYPYMNGYQHLGFATSFLRAEFLARYKRMTGHNVLFAQGFHCTGLPILGAAKRIADGEGGQVRILQEMGVPESEVPKFSDPLHWVKTFPEATMLHLKRLGAAVDWSRSFITTHLNPPYDAFVRWQFRRLKDRGYVRIGTHEVIWCPKDEAPIGDHDRLEGEGVQPVEFTLLKFPYATSFLVAATLRPETVFGQTNLWVDPDAVYVTAEVDRESWVLNRAAAEKLLAQGHEVSIRGELRGRDLVGKHVLAPGVDRLVPIFPSRFLDPDRGTGIVTSVPSDAPDDWMALHDLQRDAAMQGEFGLDTEQVAAVRPIPIIRSEGWGPLPAVEISEKMKIANQLDREKLDAAKAEIYRTGYYTGVMTEAAGDFEGLPVEEAKEKIKARLLETGQAATMWEPGEDVVCRCTTRAIVKVVEDQWFLAYGDQSWKKETHAALDRMILFPETVRRQFHYTVDWLRDWACAHHQGLGTRLPWDDAWVVESLSDSTVYMAYYTVAHALQGGKLRSDVPWAQSLSDAFFDYVFLGQGDGAMVAEDSGIDPRSLDQLRREFQYWYPPDLRNTGKDLVQNHMTFCLFNHVALFPPELWPRGFGINGYVRLGGQKMSKSKGNVWYIHAAVDEWGADVVRLMIANAGDGMDDPRLDLDFAEAIRDRLRAWYTLAAEPGESTEDPQALDPWLSSILNRTVVACREAMEAMEYRTALRVGFFELQAAWDWYVRRVGIPNAAMRTRFLETQTKLLAPFAPHLCEEVWQRFGKSDFVVASTYAEGRAADVDPEAERAEDFLRAALEDAREILRVTGIVPNRVAFFTAPGWMWDAQDLARGLAREGRLAMPSFMEAAKATETLKTHMKTLSKVAERLVAEVNRLRPEDLEGDSPRVRETSYLASATPFLGRELGASVAVHTAGEPGAADPKGKASQALPGRPAIYVE